MKTKKLANLFVALGVLISVISLAWWGAMYSFLAKQTGESLLDSVNCIYSMGGSCNFLRGMAWMRGMMPYEPALFWLALISLLMAFLLKRAIKKDELAR